MSQSTVSYLWREPQAASGFAAGVSLHSHTNQSRETLDFIEELSRDFSVLQPIIRWAEQRSIRASGIRPDYARSFWTPPLTPRLAFDLERSQIEDSLRLPALVSLSDHDDISAPLLLRTVPSARHIPVSVEWTVPYANPSALPLTKPTAFHLGIHNLPSASAANWIGRLNAFTELEVTTRPPRLLGDLLAELDALPNVLLIFNHPMWDLFRIGDAAHQVLLNDFLAHHGQFIHALELNGLRNWAENSRVRSLAAQWNQLVISGGDRHGIEPNANLNLTQALTFNDFVHEVRRDRVSNILFMPQYAQPWKHRILQSTLDAIRNYPQFPEGSRRWDERVFHPDAQGQLRPLSSLWGERQTTPQSDHAPGLKPGVEQGVTPGKHCNRRPANRSPLYLSLVLAAVRLMGARPVSGGLRLAWDDSTQMRAALSD
jgi:hypothetical protein